VAVGYSAFGSLTPSIDDHPILVMVMVASDISVEIQTLYTA